jgi:hypothetical protein
MVHRTRTQSVRWSGCLRCSFVKGTTVQATAATHICSLNIDNRAALPQHSGHYVRVVAQLLYVLNMVDEITN